MITDLEEKTIQNKVNLIKSWDKKNIHELKTMLDELSELIEQLETNCGVEQYIDFSDLPSEEFDNNLAGYPIWAMDKKGFCLVGTDLSDIESIEEIIKYLNN